MLPQSTLRSRKTVRVPQRAYYRVILAISVLWFAPPSNQAQQLSSREAAFLVKISQLLEVVVKSAGLVGCSPNSITEIKHN